MDKPDVLRRLLGTPTTSGLATRLGAAHLERRGIDPGPLLKQAGISATQLSNSSRIPVMAQIDFLELVSHATADKWIGLTLAADFDLREMGMLYYVAASSSRFGDAIQRLERYIRLGNESLILQVRKGSICSVGVSYAGVARHLDHHQIEFLALAFLRLCRQLVGRKVIPVSASFIHRRSGNLGEAKRYFGDRVEFGARTDEMCLEAALLNSASINADRFLNELMLKSCEEAIIGRSSTVTPLRTLVENAIAPLLPHGEVRLGMVARRLGLGERTLARRLKMEGLTFAEILNELRYELAISYLEDRSLPVSQIAWLLGFHGTSAFSHACFRWTGKSPVAYRRDRLTGSVRDLEQAPQL